LADLKRFCGDLVDAPQCAGGKNPIQLRFVRRSLCRILFDLRSGPAPEDLFKWEQRLAPWEERDASEVLDWIDRKEQLWHRIQSEDFVPIEIDGTAYDPFDTDGINARLGPHGLFYGAGYAQSLKPSFVLGRVDARRRTNGLAILHLGEELARDLLTLPALSQGADVVLRKEAARLFVWDQIFYITPRGGPFLTTPSGMLGLRPPTPPPCDPDSAACWMTFMMFS
jgi:hypothetical protein